jgi:aminoglycoside phosphotransferase (APT) family kinase protein
MTACQPVPAGGTGDGTKKALGNGQAGEASLIGVRNLPISAAAAMRAARFAGPGAAVTSARPLKGGAQASTWLVRTTSPEREFILREFPPGDDAAVREARVLRALSGLNGLAPVLLADGVDAVSARGWTLTSRLPGAADLAPGDRSAWASQLGSALARIHAVPASHAAGLPSLFQRREAGATLEALSGPAAGPVATDWESLTSGPFVLLHGDYYSGNTVWDGGTLTGVVDWPCATAGPPGFDVGWCRLDLYLLYDKQVADTFLASYEAALGTSRDPLSWDLWAVARSHRDVETWAASFTDLGRSDLTAAELRGRHAAWTTSLLARTPR